ncbi:hypothetical protein [Nocardia sp. NBC_00403]|uniref:hypothetical protein n=1 Tax=Nocardia sp. NBC_00403 TaxID=2975990 RepID=UPI002E2514F8
MFGPAALFKKILATRLTPAIATGAKNGASEPLYGFAGKLRDTARKEADTDRAAAIPLKNFIPDAKGRVEFTADQVVIRSMHRRTLIYPYSRYKRPVIDKINPHIWRKKFPVGVDFPPANGVDHGRHWAAAEVSTSEYNYKVAYPDGRSRSEAAHWTRERDEMNLRSRALDRPLPAGTVGDYKPPAYQRVVTVKTGFLGWKKRTVVVDDETFLKIQARAVEDYMQKAAEKDLTSRESIWQEPRAMVLVPDKPFDKEHLTPEYLEDLKDKAGVGGVYYPEGDVSTTTQGEAWKAPSIAHSSDLIVNDPGDGRTPWSHHPPGEFSSTRVRADPNHSEGYPLR